MNFLGEKPYEFLVSTVGQYVVETWRQTSHIDSHLNNLWAALPYAHSLIRRTECWRLPKYELIDKLLPHLKDAVYEAENVADELHYHRLKHKVERSWPGNFLTRHFNIWMGDFPNRVKNVQENLDNLCKEMEKACNQLQIPENHNQFSETARPTTTPFGSPTNVYGRENELNNVIALLGVSKLESGSGGVKRKMDQNLRTLEVGESSSCVEKKGNTSIICIVGMGGVGKTTLAQMVYNDRRVEDHFKKLIWICISKNFDEEKLTKEILGCVSATNMDNNANYLNTLKENLKDTLKCNRFLLVLDDAWSDKEMDWQNLLGPLKNGTDGSAILVTTRSQKVAEAAGKGIKSLGNVYLEGLEENIYWDFFTSCAFGSEINIESYPELKAIGKQISMMLKGSPLAAKTIGGLLKVNLDLIHWSNVRDSKMWQLQKEEHDILPILQLSYQYLPSHLKKCFAFCSLYPKDFKFMKTELSKFWMLHGFINSQENSQQERDTLAEVYFDELLRRCFFQKAAGSNSDKYVIPDLMHDVCQSVTKDECFCVEDEDFEEKINPNIRHLVVYKDLTRDKQNALGKYGKLHSFSVPILYLNSIYAKAIEIWCKNLTNLRSLSLVRCNYRIKKLPKSIGNLKLLQYLDVSFSNICLLPKSFCSLYNLKYLNMEGCSNYSFNRFPEGSDKLVSLQIFYFPEQGLQLEGLVNYHAKKIVAKNLRFILRDFDTIVDKIQNLRNISICGSLRIEHLEVVPSKEDALEAELSNKPLINSLNLMWNRSQEKFIKDNDAQVLQGLCPHPNLKKLLIQFYGGISLSPSWLNGDDLPNLTELHIVSCPNASTISHLPSCITKLVLSWFKQLQNFDNCLNPDCLPLLKHLEVKSCEELTSLPLESFGKFKSLEYLEIIECPKLTCPNTIVLPPSLKHLYLESCGNLDKAIPTCLKDLILLEKLILLKCLHLVSIPAEVTSSLKSLSVLVVHDCLELLSLSGREYLSSLEELNIKSCPKLEETEGRDIQGKMSPELLAKLPSASDGRTKRRARKARN